MTEIPAPLTPPECDLRDYPWMALDVGRLLTSETWVLGSGEECKAAMTMWCHSWQQVPAGSLPSDERMLAHLSGTGAAWKKVREHALRGWVKCSDGRLYHPVVCQKARESWERKLAQRARTEAARQARDAKRKGTTDDTPPTTTTLVTTSVTTSVTENATECVTECVTDTVAISVTDNATENVTESILPYQNKKVRKVPTSSASAEAVAGEAGDARTELWQAGLAQLVALTGLSPARARQRMGQLLRDCGDQCAELLGVLRDCPQTHDPQSWLSKAAANLKSRTENRGGIEQIRADWGLPSFADPSLLDDDFAKPELLQ